MRRINLKDIGIGLMLLVYMSLIALGLMSCGARKTDRQSVKEEIKTENTDNSTLEKNVDSNVKENVVIKIDNKNNTITEEVTYEPKDPTKEAFIVDPDGKKTVLNNSKKTTKKTTKNNNTQSEIKSDSEIKKKEAVKEKKAIKASSNTNSQIKHETTDRSAVSSWYLIGFVIAIIFIIVIISLLKKYKDKIWWF